VGFDADGLRAARLSQVTQPSPVGQSVSLNNVAGATASTWYNAAFRSGDTLVAFRFDGDLNSCVVAFWSLRDRDTFSLEGSVEAIARPPVQLTEPRIVELNPGRLVVGTGFNSGFLTPSLMADELYLSMIDWTDPTTPTVLGTADIPIRALDLAACDERLVVVSATGGPPNPATGEASELAIYEAGSSGSFDFVAALDLSSLGTHGIEPRLDWSLGATVIDNVLYVQCRGAYFDGSSSFSTFLLKLTDLDQIGSNWQGELSARGLFDSETNLSLQTSVVAESSQNLFTVFEQASASFAILATQADEAESVSIDRLPDSPIGPIGFQAVSSGIGVVVGEVSLYRVNGDSRSVELSAVLETEAIATRAFRSGSDLLLSSPVSVLLPDALPNIGDAISNRGVYRYRVDPAAVLPLAGIERLSGSSDLLEGVSSLEPGGSTGSRVLAIGEREEIALSTAVEVDAGSVAAGTEVSVYMLHYQPNHTPTSQTISITFESPVLGVITSDAGSKPPTQFSLTVAQSRSRSTATARSTRCA
jgi:hypothetical protein